MIILLNVAKPNFRHADTEDIIATQVWPFPEPSVVMDPLDLIKNSIKNM